MAAPDLSGITDNYFVATQKGFSDSLNGSITDAATSMTLNSTSGFTNGDSVFLWIEPGTAAAELVYGIVGTSNAVGSLVRGVIGSAAAHSSGATVTEYVSSADHMLLRKGLLVEHDHDGTHTDITATTVTASGNIETTAGAVKTDTISEHTGAAGVTIDGLLIKDGAVITAGALSPVYTSNPYKFRVYRNASQSLNNASDTKINFDTEVFDTNNNFDSSTNHRYTVPVTGFYLIGLSVKISTAGYGAVTSYNALAVNGVVTYYSGQQVGSTDSATKYQGAIVQLLSLSANDYLEGYAYVGEAGRSITVGNAHTFMWGFLVSAT